MDFRTDDWSERVERLKTLTPQEIKVLRLRCEGKSQAEIAATLVISKNTVKTHFQHIYSKIGLSDFNNVQRTIELNKYGPILEELDTADIQTASEPAVEPEPAEELDLDPMMPEQRGLIAVSEDEIVSSEGESRTLQSLPVYPTHLLQTQRNRRHIGWIIFLLVTLGLVAGITLLVLTLTPPVPSQTPTPSITPSVCGETNRATAPTPPLLRPQGVTAFNTTNTSGVVLNSKVRALAIDRRGVWIGYFATVQNPINGVGQFNRTSWANCNLPGEGSGKNVNAIVVDQVNRVWVGAEEGGVSVWDGQRWQTYTTRDGLPSNNIFGLTIDEQDNVWAATWEGVAKFDGQEWSAPYTLQTRTIFSNRVHAIAFDRAGNIWIGHINKGVSQYRKSDGQWIYHTTDNQNGIGGNEIRSIVVVRPATGDTVESVWFATADGGVSKFEQSTWTVYRVKDGLPSDTVMAVGVDKYQRVWAATDKGIAYFDGVKWVVYNTLNTLSIAFGPTCQDCPYDDEHVWTGTVEVGLTHSRLPYPDEGINVVGVRFFKPDDNEITNPIVVAPGEKFRPEITVMPRPPYQLRENRGDMLVHVDEDDALRFGAYEHMAVKGTIEAGQPFVFTDYDNFFVAPQLSSGEQEAVFTSTWRIWMFTRYTGPPVKITFMVRKS
jgi:DNA-binding CsgD family transcriptional regulator